MNKGMSRKQPAPPQPAANPAKQRATSAEEEFVDDDVFLDETLFETEARHSPMPTQATLPPPEASGRMGEVNRNSRVPKFIRRVEMMQKRSIMYYQQQDSEPFLTIVVALPTMVASCRVGVDVMSFDTESDVLLAWRVIQSNINNLLYLK
ncbi:hypothetical protein C1H46_012742 [Malus baccata]|uniref:Uncharacterized protein n=1 Tax=Malus baccata TaxID=106549 RepID=A0A540MSD4_MALBA|nr:hypothetical protein C1H46_012742 [Malus baccata]